MIWSDQWGIDGDEGWLVPGESNALVHVDFNKKKADIINYVPVNEEKKWRLFSKCIKYFNKIVCIPIFADRIWIYHLDNNTWSYIMIESSHEGYWNNIISTQKINNMLWCYSSDKKAIYKVNLDMEIIEEKFHIQTEENGRLINTAAILNNYIYIGENICEKFNLICFDMDNKSFFKSSVQIGGPVLGINCDENKIFLWNKKNDIFCGNLESFMHLVTYDYEVGFVVPKNDYLYIFANNTEDICKIKLKENTITKVYQCEKKYNKNRYRLFAPYLFCYDKGECFAVYSFVEENIYEIQNDEVNRLDIYLNVDDLMIMSRGKILDDRLKYECDMFPRIINENSNSKEQRSEIGKEIYSLLSI